MTFYLSKAEEYIAPAAVVYMRRTGSYGQDNMVLMQRFKKWLADNALEGEDTVILAMPLDDPLQTEASQCRYDVCTIYPEDRPFDPALVEVRELAGGKYVTFLLQHTAYALKTAWQECFAGAGVYLGWGAAHHGTLPKSFGGGPLLRVVRARTIKDQRR